MYKYIFEVRKNSYEMNTNVVSDANDTIRGNLHKSLNKVFISKL